MNVNLELGEALSNAYVYAQMSHHEYFTAEHVLFIITQTKLGISILENSGADLKVMEFELGKYLLNLPKLDASKSEELYDLSDGLEIEQSIGLISILNDAAIHTMSSQRSSIGIEEMLVSMIDYEKSHVSYIMKKSGITRLSLLDNISHGIDSSTSDESQTEQKSILGKFTQELTSLAKQNKFDKLIGRTMEINRSVQILNRRNKNNIIYVGEPGVGKTSIVEGIAKLIIDKNISSNLIDSKIYSLDMGTMIAGTKYRGEFEERIKKVLDEISKEKNAIVYIDEIHTIIGAGASSSGSLDAANILKPFLTTGDIKFIGSTTYEEYKQYVEKDKALIRRFQKVEIIEPTREETLEILKGLKSNYENFHGVVYDNECLEAAIDLSIKHINDRFLPDKAIDIIDEAGAFVKLNSKAKKKKVTIKDIEKTISSIARIPEKTVKEDEKETLRNLNVDLKGLIFGQDVAVETIVKQIKLSRSGLNDSTKPIANLLFIGPTGTGKTEISKQLSNLLNIPLIRFDMSEYQMQHAADKLIGTPPGYVGFEQGGLLTESIKKNPYCVLLLDEIEKAHESIYNTLLQVMDYATLTDNTGKKIDFKNVIIIMTSNIGAKDVGKSIIGFGSKKTDSGEMIDEYKKVFAPEFRNRLDNVVTFNNLDKNILENIIKRELLKLQELLLKHKISVQLTDTCKDWLVEKGLSPEFGAREIIRLIQQKIKPYFVDKVLFESKDCNTLVDIENDELTFIDVAKI